MNPSNHTGDRREYPSLRLASATNHDVPALVKLHTAAFQSDQFSNFMLYGREENTHQNHMTKSLAFWMSDPAAQIVNAVDDATGQVLGWACWIRNGEKAEPQGPNPPIQQKSTTQVEKSTVKESITAPKSSAQRLGGQMHGDMVRQEKLHMEGGVYMVLQALATDPNYQRRGIGAKLVQWGLNQADAEGLKCWIHASDSATSCRLYEAAGFQEVGYNEYDLDVWATDAGNVTSQRWGSYTFRYMVRGSRAIGITPV